MLRAQSRRALATLVAAARRLRADRRGTSSLLFALSLIPAIGCIGLGVDYMQALSRRERLVEAADAAAISAINAAKTYVATYGLLETPTQLTTDAQTVGQIQGQKTFAVDGGNTIAQTGATATITVTRTSQTITASVAFTGSMPTSLGGLFGIRTLPIGGASASTLTMGSYLDFYLALDVSGSMGLPTSTQDQTSLANLNGGCQFACHFQGQTSGYTAARVNGIKLRVDSVGTAVAHLVSTAQQTETLPGQYRVGAYPFINRVMEAAPLSTVLAGAAAVGTSLGNVYLDQGLANPLTAAMGSGGTHFEHLLPDMSSYVKIFGDGSSSSKPKPFLFIVTDGANNNQTYTSPYGFNGSQPSEPNNLTYCQYAQQLGVTIAILYVPYLPINNATPSTQGEANTVNAIIPKIPGDLKACASPGFFFTAQTDADIDAALQAMFNQALQAARLTQ